MKRLYELRRDGVLEKGPVIAENVCTFYLWLMRSGPYKPAKDIPEGTRSPSKVSVHVTATGESVSCLVSDDKTCAQYQQDLLWYDAVGRQVAAP